MTRIDVKQAVLDVDLATVRNGFVAATSRHVGGADREGGEIAIKRSGVRFRETMPAEETVAVRMRQHGGAATYGR